MSEPRRRQGDWRVRSRRREVQVQQLPERGHIMFHEALAIFWSLYVVYRVLEIAAEEPMNSLEYYTQ